MHDYSNMQSKMFVCFIALIMLMEIHNVMLENDLYKKWTLKQLLRTIGKQKVQKIKGVRVKTPLTKQQREIYTAFGLLL